MSIRTVLPGGWGTAYLQHLDEGDTEVEIRHIAADQAKAIENTDGYNGPHVQRWRHSHHMSSVEVSAGTR